MLSAMQLAGGNPLSVNLTLPSATYIYIYIFIQGYTRTYKDTQGNIYIYINYHVCIFICKGIQRDTRLYNDIQGLRRIYTRIYNDIQGYTRHDVHAYIYTKIHKDIHGPKLVGAFV